MRGSRTCVVAFGFGLALLDTSLQVDAAPASGAGLTPAPITAVPPALLKRPAVAPGRPPTKIFTTDAEGPSAIRSAIVPRRPTPSISCKADSLKLTWPLEGTAGTTWVTHNYTDLDPTAGKKDWKGALGDAAMNYDGHRGYDVVVGSFRQMVSDAVLARAAAPGKVIALEQGKYDRNLSCASGINDWNFVALQHANGFVSYYGHLKASSVHVKVGDVVSTGQALGTVGSSGCSTHPHLHFEVHDCDDAWFDPAKVPGMWTVSPTQHEVSGIMDVMLREGGITDQEAIQSPPPNPKEMKHGVLGIGLSAGLRAGDVVTFLVLNGTTPEVWSWTASGRYGHKMPFWHITLKAGATPIVVWLNNEAKFQHVLTVH